MHIAALVCIAVFVKGMASAMPEMLARSVALAAEVGLFAPTINSPKPRPDARLHDALTRPMTDIRSLNPFDWLLIAILVYSTVTAFITGFFRELFSLVGLIAGVLLASWYYFLLGSRLAAFMPWATAQIVAFLLIAILVMVLCGLAGKLVSKTVRTIGLGFVDRLLGAVFGFARGCLLGTAILMAAAAFLPHEEFIRTSRLSTYFLDGAHAVSFVVPTNLQQHIRHGVLELKHSTPEWVKRSR